MKRETNYIYFWDVETLSKFKDNKEFTVDMEVLFLDDGHMFSELLAVVSDLICQGYDIKGGIVGYWNSKVRIYAPRAKRLPKTWITDFGMCEIKRVK